MTNVEVIIPVPSTVPAPSLEIGEYCMVEYGEKNHVCVMTYSGLISLTEPRCTWDKTAPVPVKRLPLGTKIQIET